MIYELINPSDPYTLRADDHHVAAVAGLLLGQGAIGVRAIDDSFSTPILFGWDDWLAERGIDLDQFIPAHRPELADALDSVLIGKAAARQDVEDMLAVIAEDKRAEWDARRQDRHRSSMNDIGSRAKAYARRLRENAVEVAQARDDKEGS